MDFLIFMAVAACALYLLACLFDYWIGWHWHPLDFDQDRASHYFLAGHRHAQASRCRRGDHDWQHIGGRNAGCSNDCHCSVPVFVCTACGDSDYGENAEAIRTVADCQDAWR